MKIFNFKYFNTIFLILLINLEYSNTLLIAEKNQLMTVPQYESTNHTYTDHLLNTNTENQENLCHIIENDKDKDQIIEQTMEKSKNDQKNPNKFYFLFFLNRIDNFNDMKEFSNNINIFFADLLQITFYCLNKTISSHIDITAKKEDKLDSSLQYTIQHGKVVEDKKIEKLSESYMDFLLKKFNLITYMDSKGDEIIKNNKLVVNQIQLFIQNSKHRRNTNFLEFDTKVKYMNEDKLNEYSLNYVQTNLNLASIKQMNKADLQAHADQTENRFMRFVWAMLIVLVTSVGCFLLVKSSVDWATASQTELNKMRTNQLEQLTREVKNKYSYIVNTDP